MNIPGPEDITRITLKNGITVLVRPNPQSPSIVLSGFLHAGSLYDPDERLGIAHFTAAMLMRGTCQHTFDALFDLLEANGARMGFAGHTHTVSFSGKALAEDLPLLLSVLREALQEPVFPPEEVEKQRAQILTALALQAQNTADQAAQAFDALVYRGHPYARPDEGRPETIQAITRDALVDFHRRHYGPRGMVVAVVGAVSPPEVIEALEETLGGWRNDEQPAPPPLPPVQPPPQPARVNVPMAGKSQCDLVVGAAGPARTAPDYLPAMVGNTILGRFGLMGRLGDVVREQAGLAYYAYSALQGGYGPGPWEVNAGVAPENVEPALDLILQELRRFTHEPVTAEELADAQAGLIGNLPLNFERNESVAGALLTIERYNLGLDYYRTLADRIRAVTPEAILAAAQHYLAEERLAVAVAGDIEATA